jgi:hypothetical protein
LRVSAGGNAKLLQKLIKYMHADTTTRKTSAKARTSKGGGFGGDFEPLTIATVRNFSFFCFVFFLFAAQQKERK